MVITNYLSGPIIITEVLWRKEQRSGMRVVTMESKVKEWERFEDATLLALKMEEGDTNQGMQAATRSQDWKKCRERDSALVSPERTPARHWLCFNISDLQNYVVQSPCPTHCDPMDRSTPGSPVLHCFPKFAQIHACWVGDAVQPSHPLSPPFFPCPQSSPTSGSFPVSQLFDRVVKDWSFSFIISPSSEYSGLISLRID